MISVCMATYNGEKYIREQAYSILLQMEAEDELIVSDDGSTDGTIEILKSLNDDRVKIFNGPQCGLTYNFENAICHAAGDIIFLSDQDDIWEPDKIRCMKEALQGADLVVSDAWIADKDGISTGQTLYELSAPHKGFLRTLYHTSYIGCCTAFRRSILQKLLPFPPHIIMHDYWIGQIADMYYKTTFIPNKLIRYRRHGSNASALTTGKSPLSLLQKLEYRFWLLFYSIGRWRK